MEEKGRNGRNQTFWGILFLTGAAAILLSRLGYLGGISFWGILCNACLAALLIRGIFRGSFGQILFSAAFLIISNDRLLHLEAITPWPVLWAALFGTIGLKMLFPNFGRHYRINRGRHSRIEMKSDGMANGCSQDGTAFSYDNAFGSSVKYIISDVSRVAIDNAFGSTQVYFTDAKLEEGSADVRVDTCFGSVVLYVPSSWTVLIKADKAFGSAVESGMSSPDGENTLHVRGEVAFGKLEVVYT